MTISFIVTSYDIKLYLPQCLRSLSAVARPGDEVIIVDDGSTDGSAELIANGLTKYGFDPNVCLQPVCLGTNTMGGVGIPANIGMSIATRDFVFFVDGDDWIIPDSFNRARAQIMLTPADILIVNYLVFDESKQTSSRPADDGLWHDLVHTGTIETLRLQALSMISVPWRKFYRRGFLQEQRLRFPEGDFFYEDNPFHWAVCLSARSIRFLDEAVCQHRLNRPGQTMAETGMALTGFFTHFQAIYQTLNKNDVQLHLMAVHWLLKNMAWHYDKLSIDILYPYAIRAAAVLSAIPESVWIEVIARKTYHHPVVMCADRLRRGDVTGQVSDWQNVRLYQKLTEVQADIAQITQTSGKSLDYLRGQDAADQFASLKATLDRQ